MSHLLNQRLEKLEVTKKRVGKVLFTPAPCSVCGSYPETVNVVDSCGRGRVIVRCIAKGCYLGRHVQGQYKLQAVRIWNKGN